MEIKQFIILSLCLVRLKSQRPFIQACNGPNNDMNQMKDCFIHHMSYKFKKIAAKVQMIEKHLSNKINAVTIQSTAIETAIQKLEIKTPETKISDNVDRLSRSTVLSSPTKLLLDTSRELSTKMDTALSQDISLQNAIQRLENLTLDQLSAGLSTQTDLLLNASRKLSTKIDEISAQENAVESAIQSLENKTLDQLSTLLSNQTNLLLDSIRQILAAGQGNPGNFSCEFATESTVSDAYLPENCLDVLEQGFTQSGIYTIYEPMSKTHVSQFRQPMRRSINVYCDMEADMGGWLVFQRRQDGSVNFTQLWNAYRDGFGNLSSEFWLGNDNLAIITASEMTTYELRIDLHSWENNEKRYAKYNSFVVKDEQFNFKVQLGSYTGDAGDAMSYVNNQKFTTIDRDNDDWGGNCARSEYLSGFWYNACGYAMLNNPYRSSSTAPSTQGIVWKQWKGWTYSLKFTEMKIRPKFFSRK